MNLDSLKSFDWRSLQKYFSPQASADLNTFLEQMPQNTGQTMLIIAGVAWMAAGAMGLYTAVQIQQLTELRAEMLEAEALSPIVPKITDVPVDRSEVARFVEGINDTYQELEIGASGPVVNIRARATSQFGQFREAVGHIQNGGSGWRVNVDSLCVGRECEGSPLRVSLKINKVSVQSP